MKKYTTRIGLMALALLMNTLALAQGPVDFDDPDDPNPTDAPIGDHLWIVALLGLAYVFFKMKSRRKAPCLIKNNIS